MSSKQILFRLEETTAKALEDKLNEKGISKQFLFTKAVELFLEDKLSFDNNVITSNNSKKITIDSSEVAETLKKHYLNDLATLIASDSNLITLVAEKLKANIDNKSYYDDSNNNDDSNVITNDIEVPTLVEVEQAELEDKAVEGVIIPEKENKPLPAQSDMAKIGILNGRALIRRFNTKQDVSLKENISLKRIWSKGKEAFMKWSKEHDPDGYSWWLVDENDSRKGYQAV